MGRSIPSIALVLAILLGLAGRVGTVVVHAHEDGHAAHHHDDRGLVGYARPASQHACEHRHEHEHDCDHDHGDRTGAPQSQDPNGGTEAPDGSHPEHAHYEAGDGPMMRRYTASPLLDMALDVLALSAAGPSVGADASIGSRDHVIAGQPGRDRLKWPPGTTIERRLGGLGLQL